HSNPRTGQPLENQTGQITRKAFRNENTTIDALRSYGSRIAWQPAVVFILSLLVLLRTMAPTVYELDSAELATGAATLGIVHPPGYPLYTLVAHLFTLLPLRDVAFRVNLLSV